MSSLARSPTLLGLGIAFGLLAAFAAAADLPIYDCTNDNSPYIRWQKQFKTEVGSLTVHEDRIFLGMTAVDVPGPDTPQNDGTALRCYSTRDGKLLGESLHKRLGNRREELSGSPLRSNPAFDGSTMFYFTNRCELIAVDVNRFAPDSRDPAAKQPRPEGTNWKLDLMADYGVHPRGAGDHGNTICSPLVEGDFVYCVTGHCARTQEDLDRESPKVPTFIAVEKRSGKIAWQKSAQSPNEWGLWSSPAVIQVGQERQVIFSDGDGRLRALSPENGRQLWELDCRYLPKTDVRPKLQGNFFFPPLAITDGVIVGTLNRGYLSFGDNFSNPIFALDIHPNPKSATVRWALSTNEIGIIPSSIRIDKNVVYAFADGWLLAWNLHTGKELGRSDLLAGSDYFDSPVIHNGRIYVPSDEGLFVLALGPQLKKLARYDFRKSLVGVAFDHDGNLFVADRHGLYAVREGKYESP